MKRKMYVGGVIEFEHIGKESVQKRKMYVVGTISVLIFSLGGVD